MRDEVQYSHTTAIPGLVLSTARFADFRFEPHYHLDFHVALVANGAQRQSFKGESLLLTPGAIRVNTLSPGPIHTPGLVELAGPDAAQQQGLLDYLTTQVPLGRMGQPEDIAKAAVFLASDDSAFVNGIELFADGGQAQV